MRQRDGTTTVVKAGPVFEILKSTSWTISR
jgi:hypothetical protein